jgi:hypothetical protein
VLLLLRGPAILLLVLWRVHAARAAVRRVAALVLRMHWHELWWLVVLLHGVTMLLGTRDKASAHGWMPWAQALLLRLEGSLRHLLLLRWHAVLPLLLHVHRRKGVLLLLLLLLLSHHRLHALWQILLRLMLGCGWWRHPLVLHWGWLVLLLLHRSCPLHGAHWAWGCRRSSWRLWRLLLLLWPPATLLGPAGAPLLRLLLLLLLLALPARLPLHFLLLAGGAWRGGSWSNGGWRQAGQQLLQLVHLQGSSCCPCPCCCCCR